jgi:putative toxin-antitoxin system antitoxin component (TIGR02293 family)
MTHIIQTDVYVWGLIMAETGEIAEVLGGRKTLRTAPRTTAEWQVVLRKGVPVQSAEALKRRIAIGDDVLAGLLGVSEKTLSRARTASARLDPVASDRLFRVARIGALAIEVLEGEAPAVHWLKRPQIGLGGSTPLSLLTTDVGCAEVEKLLLRIEHGVYT